MNKRFNRKPEAFRLIDFTQKGGIVMSLWRGTKGSGQVGFGYCPEEVKQYRRISWHDAVVEYNENKGRATWPTIL